MTTRLALALAVLAVVASPAATRAGLHAAGALPQTHDTHKAPPDAPQGMAEMKKMHAQMTAEMNAGDARLEALLKEMDAAPGAGKVDKVAAVVRELVQQHRGMHTHMGQMHQDMMGGRGRMMGR